MVFTSFAGILMVDFLRDRVGDSNIPEFVFLSPNFFFQFWMQNSTCSIRMPSHFAMSAEGRYAFIFNLLHHNFFTAFAVDNFQEHLLDNRFC